MKLSISEKNRLKTKYGDWAIVTGATSGIGLEIACQLASVGINLIISGRSATTLTSVKNQLKNTFKIDVKTVEADFSIPNTTTAVINAANGLPIGLLVVSAGYGTSGLFVKSAIEAEIDMVKVNCEALLLLTHHYANQFSKQGKGGILLMSSMVAFQGVPYSANYAATKAYVQTLAEALAVELKPMGVDVLAAAPGPVDSGFATRANMKMGFALTPAQVGVPILKALGRQTTVLPGLLTKVLVYSLRTVPRWAKIKIMQAVMGGMTKHQAS